MESKRNYDTLRMKQRPGSIWELLYWLRSMNLMNKRGAGVLTKRMHNGAKQPDEADDPRNKGNKGSPECSYI
jgi:hypothetical protein